MNRAKFFILFSFCILFLGCWRHMATAQNTQPSKTLIQNHYRELPLGAIQPDGWLKEMLIRQKNGATGKLDSLYPLVMNNRNGWLGGDGDQWERGPYWIDGLLPLAYLLNDTQLIAKTKPWVEWAIKSQQPDGYFGPSKDYGYEPGLQRDNSRDWWPKIVMLKVLKQYYSATGDKRVITLMTNYFKYQLKELPQKPLDHWTFWARYRAGDNLMIVYWLYRITGDKFLLDLGDLIHKQSFDFTDAFANTNLLSTPGSIHGVNLAQGLKEPVIYYQAHPEKKYIDAVNKGLSDLRRYNGTAQGMYGADEALHGNSPTQGSELCSVVELMFSLESMLEITGDISYGDQIEKIAFNALPAQVSEDYMSRQYFQQANQVMLTRHVRNFDVNHEGTDVCFGLLTGYPCCTSNMHQGWPKFTQNLWYSTADKGIAALLFAPNTLTTTVGNGRKVTVKEETLYPFEESVKFSLSIEGSPVQFPFYVRIPEWCKEATIKINGAEWKKMAGNQSIKIERQWSKGDVVELLLPMHIIKNKWHENSVSIERGPLTYGLKIGEEERKVVNDRDPIAYGKTYFEVRPTTAWNYALLFAKNDELDVKLVVEKQSQTSSQYPWTTENAPLKIKARAVKIPSWQLYNDMTGAIPYSLGYQMEVSDTVEEVTLIPFGCTRLRIAQFPEVRK